jgi:hypothetical protein
MAGILYRKEQDLLKRNCIVEGLLVDSMNDPHHLRESPEEWNCGALLIYMGNNAITKLKSHRVHECCAEANSDGSFTKHGGAIFRALSLDTAHKHAD